MKTIWIIPPYYPLIPKTDIENIDKEPNSDFQKQNPLLIPSFSFFIKSCSFLLLEYELSKSKKPKTLNSCIDIIASKKPKLVIFDISETKHLKEYKINTTNIIQKIKLLYPDIKIRIIDNDKERLGEIIINRNELLAGKYQEINQEKIKEIKKYIKREEHKLLVVQDLTSLDNTREALQKEIYSFWFLNFKNKNLQELKKLKNNYFDLDFLLNINYKDATIKNLKELKNYGLEKAIIDLPFNTEFLNNAEYKNGLKEMADVCKIELDIILENQKNNNQELLEFIGFLEQEKISYRLQQTEILDAQTNKDFETATLLSIITNNQNILNRLKKEIPVISKKTNFENIVDFILKTESKYLELYIDIAHFLDGLFTKDEILEYLKKLYPNTNKGKLEKIVCDFITLLEKELFIDYLNKKQIDNFKLNTEKSHYLSVFPRRENQLLIYSDSEKGYIFGQNKKNIEEVPSDVFFFFVFSKGVFALKEVASKLHLLFKDTKEYSKENYLKTTKKVYETLKHYRLCK
jgi:hypothetical protein